MGCCLLAALAIIGPRFVLVMLWLFSDYLSRAFGGGLIPFLGFFFLPLTTLAYAWVVNSGIGVNSLFGLAIVVIAFLLDIGALGSGVGANRRRRAY